MIKAIGRWAERRAWRRAARAGEVWRVRFPNGRSAVLREQKRR